MKAGRVGVGCVVGILALAAVPAGGAAAVDDPGRLKVVISGLPDDLAARVRVVGPNPRRHPDSWQLGSDRTLTGLLPGSYAVVARDVKTATGQLLAAKVPTRWVRVGEDQKASVRVTYAPLGPFGETSQRMTSVMPRVCKIQYEDNGASANYVAFQSPFSWYCNANGETHLRIDIAKYCKVQRNGWVELQGDTVNDWYCVWWD